MIYRKYADVFVILAIASWTLVALMSGVPRLVALPFVLIVPGYSIMSAAFPVNPFSDTQRIMLVIGLSLVCLILLGFALNLIPVGLQMGSWLVGLFIITVVACAIIVLRRQPRELPIAMLNLAINWRQCMLLVCAVCIAGVAYWLAQTGAAAPTGSFTQFWLLPADTGNSTRLNEVEVGIQNAEGKPLTYRVVLTKNGAAFKEWPAVTLGTGEIWHVSLPVLPEATEGTLNAELYLGKEVVPYRSTRIALGK